MNNPVNFSDEMGGWPKWLSGALEIVSGVCQIVAYEGGAAVAAATSWTGVGAVAGVAMIVNGAANIVSGGSKIINDVTNEQILPEENLIKTACKSVGEAIGGEAGEAVGATVYDVANTVADVVSIASSVTSSIKTASTISSAVSTSKNDIPYCKSRFILYEYN